MGTVSELAAALEELAPARLAAEWDNVGLLLEGTRPVRRVFLCVDLTEAVLGEALAADVDAVVAYHPPLFRPVSRLTHRSPQGRVLLGLARAGVHLLSPHTALDAAPGGMTDWLAAVAGPLASCVAIEPHAELDGAGSGRLGTLADPAPLDVVVGRVKAALALPAVRLAVPAEARPIRTVAVCPGSGGSVVGKAGADLVLTGELGHHEVLARVAAGAAVILTEHSNSERGYLPTLAARLVGKLPGIEARISVLDRDPLRVA